MTSAPGPRGRRMRPEIQALRALAVGLVVTFHFFPFRLPGGFVGVDVFFVISGFLITGNLLREAGRTSHIRVGRFLARRVKRLIPASLLVVLAVSAATALWVPQHLWAQFYSEYIAATLYVQNWLLASNAVDYLAATNQASPVQHFWTLSVEEQFYLILPLLLIATIVVGRAKWRTLAGWCLFVIFGASFVYSIVLTTTDHATAYFSTGTRAWEFAAGSLLAYLGWHAPHHLRTAVSVLGALILVGSGLLMNGSLPFPGATAAIPVLGVLLVLWAGMPTGVLGWAYRLRPVQWLGGISYSLYLWHWPLIVIFPFVVGHPASTLDKVFLIAFALVLAAASKYLVEDPFLGIKHDREHLITFGTAWVGIVAVLVVATGCTAAVRAETRKAAESAMSASQAHPGCFGAMSMRPHSRCTPTTMPPVDPAFAKTDAHGVELGECAGGVLLERLSDGVSCQYGDPKGTQTVVIAGDSHARQWVAPFDELSKKNHLRLVTYVHPSCPLAAVGRAWHGVVDAGCAEWVRLAVPSIVALHPALVVDAALVPAGYSVADYTLIPTDQQVLAHRAVLSALVKGGSKVVVMADTPYQPQDVPDCLAAHPVGGGAACAGRRSEVLDNRPQPLVTAAQGMTGVTTADLSDFLCTPADCPAVIGGVIVYMDRQHLTKTFADSLEPILASILVRDRLLPDAHSS